MKHGLLLLGGAAAGGLGALLFLRVLPHPSLALGPAGWLLVCALMPLVFWSIVAIHEIGHLAGGWLGRFHPCLLIVGPLQIERTHAGWRVGVNRVFPLAGGLAAATPSDLDRLRERMTLLIAGGPAASVLVGLLLLALPAVVGIDRTDRLARVEAVAYVLLLSAAIGSLGIGAAALIPSHGHGFASDGARIRRFLQEGPDVDGEVALLAIVGVSMAGRRPRDWDPGLLQLALELDIATPQGVAARILAFNHALDRGDIGRARALLTQALTWQPVLPKMSQPSLLLQAAYFEARHDHNPSSARRRLADAAEGALVAPYARPLAEAAILVEEDDPGAGDRLAAAARHVARSIDRGSAVMAAELVAELGRLASGAARPAATAVEPSPVRSMT